MLTLLCFQDTAGQEEYSAIRDQYIRAGHGFVLVYRCVRARARALCVLASPSLPSVLLSSITSRSSFETLAKLQKKIQQVKEEENQPWALVVVVGNKCDLEEEREVTTVEGKRFADTFGQCDAPHLLPLTDFPHLI